MPERWYETYSTEVEVYDLFSKYEDEGNLLFNRLKEYYSFAGKEVLEIGCGTGKYTKLIAPLSAKLIALDISEIMINVTKEKCKEDLSITYLTNDMQDIPLEDNSVDCIFGSWAISACYPKEVMLKAIKEVIRVVRPEGDIWLFENYWDGEFIELRDVSEGLLEEQNYLEFAKRGFKMEEVINTNFGFPDLEEAKRLMGFILGDKAILYLDTTKNPKIKHKVMILHYKKQD